MNYNAGNVEQGTAMFNSAMGSDAGSGMGEALEEGKVKEVAQEMEEKGGKDKYLASLHRHLERILAKYQKSNIDTTKEPQLVRAKIGLVDPQSKEQIDIKALEQRKDILNRQLQQDKPGYWTVEARKELADIEDKLKQVKEKNKNDK